MNNCSIEDYPTAKLGHSAALAVHSVFLTTALSALIGNSLVIRVYWSPRLPHRLRLFLLHLAAADIFCGVFCIPFIYLEHVLGTWSPPLFMCPLIQFSLYLSVWVQSFTLTTISVERFFALLKPFKPINAFLRDHSQPLLLLIWSLGLLYAGVGSFGTKVVTQTDSILVCRQHVLEGVLFARVFSFCNFFFTFFFPMTTMCVFYALLIRRLTSIPRITSSQSLRTDSSVHSKSVKTLVVLLLSFAICLSPSKVLSFVLLYRPKILSSLFCFDPLLTTCLKLVINWLFAMHSVLNPVLYCFLCHGFRVNDSTIKSN